MSLASNRPAAGPRPRLRGLASAAQRLRSQGAEESGAGLVIVAGCLELFRCAGACAVDLGSGRQARAQATSTSTTSGTTSSTATVTSTVTSTGTATSALTG